MQLATKIHLILACGIVEMVLDPYAFWESQRLFSPEGLSWNSIAGYVMVYSANAAVTSEILKSNGPTASSLCCTPTAPRCFEALMLHSS